jgi:hypothetical protein
VYFDFLQQNQIAGTVRVDESVDFWGWQFNQITGEMYQTSHVEIDLNVSGKS